MQSESTIMLLLLRVAVPAMILLLIGTLIENKFRSTSRHERDI